MFNDITVQGELQNKLTGLGWTSENNGSRIVAGI
jgi:hypothetical protein